MYVQGASLKTGAVFLPRLSNSPITRRELASENPIPLNRDGLMSGVYKIVGFIVVAGLLIATFFGIPVLALWMVAVFLGAEGRATKAQAELKKVMMADEQVIVSAIQYRVFALFSRRELVAITNSRVITMTRGLLGGFKMTDIQWKDLIDATIEQNVLDFICGSNLRFAHIGRPLMAIRVEGVPSEAASTMYARAQHEEQAWEEKRRVRGMEEVRAAAGGVVVHAGAQGTGGGVVDDIQKAKAMFDAGVISDAEFQEMKAKILAG